MNLRQQLEEHVTNGRYEEAHKMCATYSLDELPVDGKLASAILRGMNPKRRQGIQDQPLSRLAAAPYKPVQGPTLALCREGGVLVARVVSEAGEVLREVRGEDAARLIREALGVEVQADDQPLTIAALAGQPCELRYTLPKQEEKP